MSRIVALLGALTAALTTTLTPVPVGAAAAPPNAVLRPLQHCGDLQGLAYDIPGAAVHITAADASDPSTCDVRGTVDPAVRFDLKLPISTFTGRYVQYGCQGECGAIFPPPAPSCSPPQGGDFAVAATDDGHEGDPQNPILDASWGATNQAARNDFFYRAPHVVALAAKRLIAIYTARHRRGPTSLAARPAVGKGSCSRSATRATSTASSPVTRPATWHH